MTEDRVAARLERMETAISALVRHIRILEDRVPSSPELLSAREVELVYGMSRTTLYDLARKGRLHPVKVRGKGTRWSRGEIEDLEQTAVPIDFEPEQRGRRSRAAEGRP